VLGTGKEGWDWDNKLLKEVDITKPPYTTHYPSLAGFMAPHSGQLRINRAANNVFVKCADVYSGNWQVHQDENWITDSDPGFVNASAGDFRLERSSKVFWKLPGFQPIPFEKIGLIKNVLRPTVQKAPCPYDLQKP
jgi:hypothetical protein